VAATYENSDEPSRSSATRLMMMIIIITVIAPFALMNFRMWYGCRSIKSTSRYNVGCDFIQFDLTQQFHSAIKLTYFSNTL
jgi:hypothetical protein